MSRISILVIASVFVSTALSAPNTRADDQTIANLSGPEITNNQLQPESPNDVGTRTIKPVDGARTLIMFGVLRWIFSVVKAMIKPARVMYLTMLPEISAFRCLSESKEFQNVMGFSGTDFEGYLYETPRSPDTSYRNYSPQDYSFQERTLSIDENNLKSQRAFQTDTQHLHQEYASLAPYTQHQSAYYAQPENDVSRTYQHRSDEVLKRIPRFIDEVASLLKEGQAMECIMPYMRERVTRWLDG